MAKCLKSLKNGSVCWIGRLAASDIVTSHSNISSKHCILSISRVEVKKKATVQEVGEYTKKIEGQDESALLPSNRYCRLYCTITDHSSNGTWLKPHKPSDDLLPCLSSYGVYKLKHRSPTEINIGDIIYLLAPTHSDCFKYQYMLCQGVTEDELVLCQRLDQSPNSKSNERVSSTVTQETTTPDVLVKRSYSERKENDFEESLTKKVKESNQSPMDRTSNKCTLSPAPLSRELSQEQCPHCQCNFNIIDLIQHVKICQSTSQHVDIPDGPIELTECIYCCEEYPLTELIEHTSICLKKKEEITTVEEVGSTRESEERVKEDVLVKRSYSERKENDFEESLTKKVKESNQSPMDRTGNKCTLSPAPLSRELSQEQCPHCQCNFNIIDLIQHVKICQSTSQHVDIPDGPIELTECIYCCEEYPLTELIEHTSICLKKKEEITTVEEIGSTRESEERVKEGAEPLERCMMCFCDFPLSKLISHASHCTGDLLGSRERFKDFLPSAHDVDALTMSVLTSTQQEAVDYVRQISQKEASEDYPDLCMRVINLGYTPKDLQKVLHWVRNSAPIIIHINLDRVLHHLVKDTHYRNLFEIGSGGGSCDHSARRGWENNIFNNIYDSSLPMERVKYGVLNIVGDPHGVRCCYSYGDSFFQLKKVRLRTTFASMDTSSSSVKLSCCEHYGNVLNEYSDPELTAILDVATQRKPYMKSTMITHYKEVQIHGPVCLSENVDCIVVNGRHRGNRRIEKLLDKFVEKNKCNLIWMAKDRDSPMMGGLSWDGLGPSHYDDDDDDSEEVYYSEDYDSPPHYGGVSHHYYPTSHFH